MSRNHRNEYSLHLAPLAEDRPALAPLAAARALLAERDAARRANRRLIAWGAALAAAALANVVAVIL